MKLKNNLSLKKSITLHKKIFSIYGLGNVGGPIAAAWLKKGAKVIGVDVSKNLLEEIKHGNSHKHEPFISEIFSKSFIGFTATMTTRARV